MFRPIVIVSFSVLLLFSYFVSAQNTDFLMDDRDGNVYLVARFNNTWWMCQNLKFDGGEGTGCYNEDETNCMLRGRLYDQSSAIKSCPEGYHLPSDDEWKDLESYLGMKEDELDKNLNRNSGTVGKYLRMGGGLGFDADLVGMINLRGNSIHSGSKAYFWTSSEDGELGWARIIDKNRDGVERKMYDSKHKLSVRCVKQDPNAKTGERLAPPEEKPDSKTQGESRKNN